MNAKEKIAKLHAEFDKQVESLKTERLSELENEIDAAKKAIKAAEDHLKALQDEKAEWLGKKPKAAAPKKAQIPELSEEESEKLSVKVASIVKEAGSKGINIGDLVKQTGSDKENIKGVIKLNKAITTTGKGRGTLYLIK